MRHQKRSAVACFAGVMLCGSAASHADTLFSDSFSLSNTYSGGTSSGAYTAADEDSHGIWTAGGGTLTYSRTSQNPPATGNSFHYSSSVLLTNGSTPATGSTAGLSDFTVSTTIYNIPPANTAQPGLIISGSLGTGSGTGGYLLEDDTGAGNAFVLLSETGHELVSDEQVDGPDTGLIVKNFGVPTVGHSYAISVTMHRSADTTQHSSFDVTITDIGPDTPGTFYSGTFSDLTNTSGFGGTQIGVRVRDAHDEQPSGFGPITLSTPEPAGVGGLAVLTILFARRRRRSIELAQPRGVSERLNFAT